MDLKNQDILLRLQHNEFKKNDDCDEPSIRDFHLYLSELNEAFNEKMLVFIINNILNIIL
jgi:hypothetical protein